MWKTLYFRIHGDRFTWWVHWPYNIYQLIKIKYMTLPQSYIIPHAVYKGPIYLAAYLSGNPLYVSITWTAEKETQRKLLFREWGKGGILRAARTQSLTSDSCIFNPFHATHEVSFLEVLGFLVTIRCLRSVKRQMSLPLNV